MVNENIAETIGKTDLNTVWDYLSYLPKIITEKLTELSISQGLNVTTRWISLVVLFLSLLLFYFSLKISKLIIKITLVILSLLLILGSLIPGW